MKVVLLLAVVLFVVILGVLALPFLIDLNPYVAEYKPQIEDALQRKVELKDIRLTMWPRLGARVSGFTIMDDAAFGTQPFASFNALEIGVKLRPLLSGRVEVEEISLRDPVITAIKNKDGVLNASTIGSKGAAAPEPSKPQAPAPAAEGGPLKALALLAVDRISLTNGQLIYRDLSIGPKPSEYVLQDLNVHLTDVRLGRLATVHMETVVHPLKLPITVDARAGPLVESGELKDLDVKIGLGKTLLALAGSIMGGQAKLTLTSPSINSADLPAELPLTKPVLVKDLKAHVEAPYPTPAGSTLMDVLTLQPLELNLVMGDSMIGVKGSVMNHRAKAVVTSSAIKSGDLPINLSLDKPVVIKDLAIQAETPFPLSAGAPVLDSLLVQSMELAAVMGGSTVTVKGSAVGGAINVRATSPAINTGDLPVSIAALKKPVDIKNLQMTALVKGNQARVTDLAFQLFGGQVKSGAGITLNATPIPFDGKLAIAGLQLGPVMDALGSDKVSVSGTTVADVSLRGRGYTMPELTQALEGTGHLALKDGKLEGMNLAQEAMTVLKVLGVSPDAVKATAFSAVEADWSIKQGVVHLHKLLMDSHDFNATAQGTIDFDQRLDLKANLALSQALSHKAGSSTVAKLMSSGGRITVPLLIGGTMQAPTYALHSKALGGKVQEKIQEKVQEQADKLLKGKAGEEIKKGAETLKRLFGQ